jgi:hypothetical protein
MRRGVKEALMSAATVTLVLLVLVGFDERVRTEIGQRFGGNPSHQLSTAGQQAQTLTAVIAEAARDQSVAHAPMLIFAVASTVLVLFMLKT